MIQEQITGEQISVFDIFKIGIGPSSSHTLGPWKAAHLFISELKKRGKFSRVKSIKILLYGSLAKTGLGHATDIAVMLGLSGDDPVTFDTDAIQSKISSIKSDSILLLNAERPITFRYAEDLLFLANQSMDHHPNALTFQAFLDNGSAHSETYYSVGGGFVTQGADERVQSHNTSLPFPVNNAAELLGHANATGLSIADIVYANELLWRSPEEIRYEFSSLIKVIKDSVFRGCHTFGMLPGGLNVSRRAASLNLKLLGEADYAGCEHWMLAVRNTGNDFSNILDWVTCFAIAVNEENAAMGRIVTAPTNGAAGVIPAVLMYYVIFCFMDDPEHIMQFLLTAAEIGSIFKRGATISAAMGGCQAEIGVSSAMAAAALTECLGGSPAQALMAAEIAMEHHLGLTCDPVGGLVQIPCIERNAMGATKAITASQLALKSDPVMARVSLDTVVNTMWFTALDMNSKYKETSDGGLAIYIPISLPDC